MSLEASRQAIRDAQAERLVARKALNSSLEKAGGTAKSLDFKDFTCRHPLTGLGLAAGAGFLLCVAGGSAIARRGLRVGSRVGIGMIAKALAENLGDVAGGEAAE
ncbi:hypothetical protein KQI84_00690 [bacterium]|nr:hypothetical protein [bacterium]